VNFRVDSYDDPAIRARDGYAFIMAVRQGDRMPCPKCGYTIRVPKFEMAETSCDYCKMLGRDGRYTACYFPLEGDSLIQHLSKLDPLKTWRDGLAQRADAHNAQLLASRERDCLNKLEAATKENFNQLVGIQSVGYTGKEAK
jgi:hypothetical protein